MSAFDTYTDIDGLFKFNNISKRTRRHLSEVYMVLSFLVGSCAVGSFLNIAFGIGSRLTGLMGLFCIIYIAFSQEKTMARLAALIGFGLLEGMSIGPLINASIQIDPSLILTAFVASLGIFVCFSVAALLSDQRTFMYLGAILGSFTTILMLFSLLYLFGVRSEFFFHVNLYLSLFVFMGYIIYDTQLIVYRSEHGARDVYVDALNLFIDLVAVFVRILIILMEKREKKKD